MQPIEIRYNKKKAISIISLLVISTLGVIVCIHTSGKFANNYNVIGASALMIGIMVYSLYRPVRQILKNQPVITLSKSGIEINQNGKQFAYSWVQVTEWKIEKDEDKWYLTLQL